MKVQYETVFVAHVKAALEKANALGIKATWTTAKHLDALAETILTAITQPDVEGSQHNSIVRDVLAECYNVSAYQQVLAKKFEATGHFQREGAKTAKQSVDDLLSQLAIASAATPKQG